ncbi:MAG: 50S ribosomal protein L13 [Candidatus Aenigmatarchaeota archaeon]
MIIDANGAILGRLASRVAKKLLKGEEIIIINAEKAIVSGNPRASIKIFLEKTQIGDPHKGPFYPRYPDKIIRRTVRGMLPYKREKGKKALRRLKVYISSNNMKGEKICKDVKDLRTKYITLGEICKRIGKYGKEKT